MRPTQLSPPIVHIKAKKAAYRITRKKTNRGKVLVILSHQKHLASRRRFIVAATGLITKEFVVIHTKIIWPS